VVSCIRSFQLEGNGNGHREVARVRKEIHRSLVQPQGSERCGFFFGGRVAENQRRGPPSVGRTAITAAAQGFMTAFPDMVVTMDGISVEADQVIYRWTMTGRNTGPGGTRKTVRISGYEEWTIGPDGLILESKGHFDEAEYNSQLTDRFDGK